MKEKPMMVTVLVTVSSISALLLAGVDHLSSDRIRRNKERRFQSAVLSVLDIPAAGRAPEAVYGERIEKREIPQGALYLSRGDEGRVEGAAFSVVGSGFWGPISVMVGVGLPHRAIKGIEILEQGETPGLGARIEEPEFRQQLVGKRLDLPIVFQIKGARPGPNDIVAISGATITSKSLETIVNEVSRPYLEALKELDNG